MRISPFILSHMEVILAEWEAFATTLRPAADGLNSLALRDHARQILEAIAHDLERHQTREQQSEKSKGCAPILIDAPETAAQTHAVLRARDGFDINQLVSEYRALRASVLRLWIDATALATQEVADVIRFNEAIDQAVAESIGHFHSQVERSRNLLLGMLGHDMRSPLQTIVATATYLGALNASDEVSTAANRLIRSGASMQALLDDLVDFNRTRLGLGLNIAPTPLDLAATINDELDQWRGAHPDRQIQLETIGNTQGRFDGPRLQQVIRNLISNAMRYSDPQFPIRVTLRGNKSEIGLQVINAGPPIDPSMINLLFDPLCRGITENHRSDSGLGLGLFIVREIAHAHGGEVDVHCDSGETCFTVHLPRQPTP